MATLRVRVKCRCADRWRLGPGGPNKCYDRLGQRCGMSDRVLAPCHYGDSDGVTSESLPVALERSEPPFTGIWQTRESAQATCGVSGRLLFDEPIFRNVPGKIRTRGVPAEPGKSFGAVEHLRIQSLKLAAQVTLAR